MSSGCSCDSGSWLPVQCPGAMQGDTDLPWGWLCLVPDLWVLSIPCPVLGLCFLLPGAVALLSISLPHQAGQKQSICAGSVPLSHFFPAELAGCAAPLGAHSDIACSPDEDGAYLTCTQQIKLLCCCLIFCCCQSSTGCCLLLVSQFPGEMWAGNCIAAVEDSCVTLLAADDALYPHMT